VADFRRSPRNMREILRDAIEPIDAAPTPHDQLEGKEARELLRKALDTLDLDRRAVFVMHELDEIPMPEIASVLAIPVNTAYSRLRLARGEIASVIERSRVAERRQHA